MTDWVSLEGLNGEQIRHLHQVVCDVLGYEFISSWSQEVTRYDLISNHPLGAMTPQEAGEYGIFLSERYTACYLHITDDDHPPPTLAPADLGVF